jgi:polysaccharide export outer membrane protein
MRSLVLLLLVGLSVARLGAQTALVTMRPGDTFEMRLGAVPLELAQEFNSTYSVSQAGTVNIPLIGETRVVGLTPQQVEQTVQNKLIADKLFTHPSVNINPVPNSRMITIGGGVRAPQRLPWSADLTMGTAIQIAGGLSDWGSLKAVRLIRDGQQEIYDARKFEKNPSLDPKLLPGDQVIVPQ